MNGLFLLEEKLKERKTTYNKKQSAALRQITKSG